MGYFKLKSGAFTTGEGKDLKFYTANDPTNNVVESEQELEKRFPEMFQEVEKPPAPQRAVGMYGIEKPPPPATPEEAQLQAILLQPITREEMKARADRLRQMADALEQRSQEGQQASQQDQTGKEWQQAAAGARSGANGPDG
jgi:type IV secretory pathway VirB10-like protein